jgi:23S rRNA (cytosine1962-C5)-methyltransferase
MVTPDTVGPVAHGHPWVYRNGIAGGGLPSPGEPVLLVDPRGRPLAFGLADDGEIAVRVLGREPCGVEALLARRIRAADAFRRRVLPSDTDAWRVVNGEGDRLPGLVLDRYGDLAVLRLYSAAWLPWMDVIVAEIAALPWARAGVRRHGVTRVDGAASGGGSDTRLTTLFGAPPDVLVVTENGLRFLVRPALGQKTGLFLDQRENRRWLRDLARERVVVNLFGYNGAFSVYAAAGGATRTVTVDLAADALADARENFALNGLDPSAHAFEAADAFTWRPGRGERVGCVICDPPSLAREERSDQVARKAYRDLNAHAARMMDDEGVLLTCSCTARMSDARWMEAVQEGLRQAGGAWRLLRRAYEPLDHPVGLAHPEGRYLKAAGLQRDRA